jgi:hypothetical protein
MSALPSKKLIFFLLAFPVCAALAIILIKHRQDPYRSAQVPYGLPSPDIHRAWAHQNFTTIDGSPAFHSQLKKALTKKPAGQLTSLQEQELENSVELFVMAYHSGLYSDYLRFRTPVTATLDQAKVQSDKEWLAKVAGRPLQDQEVQPFMWEIKHGTNEYWKGISLDSATINVEETAQMPEDLTKHALSIYHWGAMTIQPSFKFEKEPQQLLKDDGKLTFATASFVVMPTSPDPPALVHIRLYWTPPDQKWLPWELVISHNGNFKRLPIF